MKIGLVFYADDPDNVFRRVYPTESEAELNDERWITEGLDPARPAVMRIVEPDSPEALASSGWLVDAPLYVAGDDLVSAGLDFAGVGATDTVVDLGSGSGPFLVAAAKRGARAIGYETSGLAIAAGYDAAAAAGVTIEQHQRDFRTADLSAATVLILNLGSQTPDALPNAPPGTRVVSVNHQIGGLGEPSRLLETPDHDLLRLWVI